MRRQAKIIFGCCYDPPSRPTRIAGMYGLALARRSSVACRPPPGRCRVAMTGPRNDTDQARRDDADPSRLIHAVATHGDRAAFAALFARFAPRVKAYLLRLGLDNATAEEQSQEALLIVWRKAAQFDPARATAAAWIFTIARNLRIDAARRAQRPPPVPDPVDEPSPTPAADVILAAEDRSARVRAALAALPAEQADVIRLAFFDDRPHADIERALGIPLGTVKSRLRLAMSRLRGLLDDDL
jgi:RNA polymerase sigma-70 factor (ECF subfamily)